MSSRTISRIASTAMVLSLCAGMALEAGAAPARADIISDANGILGNIPVVGAYVKQIEGYYTLASNIINDLTRDPSKLAPMQLTLKDIQTTVLGQMDALAVADVTGDADLTVQQFQTVTTMSPDTLAAFVARAVGVITHAKADLSTPSITAAAVDQLGFDINTIGPIAMASAALAGETPASITTLKTDLIQADQTVLTKLAPNCGFSPYPGDNVQDDIDNASNSPFPGDWPHIPVAGYGACVSYLGHAPAPNPGGASDVNIWPTGAHTGRLPWDVTGEGVPEITAFTLLTGAFVNWPTPAPDYSIAIEEAMADTSYPIAEAALRQLQAPQSPTSGNSTAVVNVPAWAGGGSLAFAVGTDGGLNVSNSAFTGNRFTSWSTFDTPGPLTSVAATIDDYGVIQLFALDRAGQIYHRRGYMGGTPSWTQWSKLDGNLNSIAVASNADGAVEIFGTQINGAVFTRTQVMNADYAPAYAPNPALPANDTWTAWSQMGSGIYKVAAATHANGEIEVDGIVPGGAIVSHTRQTAPNSTTFTGWGAAMWTGNGGGASFSITDLAVGATVNGFGFYATGSDGNIYQNSEATLDGYNQGPWVRIGTNVRNVSATFNAPDTQLIGVRPDGTTVADTIGGGVIGGSEGWTAPMTGATVRATNGLAPVITSVTPAGGTVTLTWTDGSPNEDNFVVLQVTRSGGTVAELSDQASPNKTGMGEQVSFTDAHPASTDPSQQCYQVFAYDMVGSFAASSDTKCAA